MSLDQSLAEELNQLTYPLEESNVVEILLTKFRSRQNMLSQESKDIEAKIAEATATLEEEQKQESLLHKKHSEQRKKEQESRELIDFVRSFSEAKAVTVDGREIIADIWRTRAQEDEYYEQLKREIEELKAEESELVARMRARHSKYVELSTPLMEFMAQEWALDAPSKGSQSSKDAEHSKERGRDSATPAQEVKEKTDPEQDGKADDVDMDLS